MNLNDFKTLRIGSQSFKRLATASGIVLFDKTDIRILPDTADLQMYDYSTMIPNRCGMSVYQNGQFYTSVDSSTRYVLGDRVRFYGARGSVTFEYDVYKSSDGSPTRIVNYSKVGTQGLNYLPSDGYAVTHADAGRELAKYDFTNPVSDTQIERVTISWGLPTVTPDVLSLDDKSYKTQSGDVILTIGDDFVGYSGAGFEPNPTYDFKEHRGETFDLTSTNGLTRITFSIG